MKKLSKPTKMTKKDRKKLLNWLVEDEILWILTNEDSLRDILLDGFQGFGCESDESLIDDIIERHKGCDKKSWDPSILKTIKKYEPFLTFIEGV